MHRFDLLIKDRLDSDMTPKKRILAFEIGTFFTRYVVFENGRMGIPGTVRASFALYNTMEEVDALVAAVDRVRKMF